VDGSVKSRDAVQPRRIQTRPGSHACMQTVSMLHFYDSNTDMLLQKLNCKIPAIAGDRLSRSHKDRLSSDRVWHLLQLSDYLEYWTNGLHWRLGFRWLA